MKRTIEFRFWPKVRVSEPDDCWEWMAHRMKSGYGTLTIDNHPRMAHRIAYEISVGPIPNGMEIDHICHNPSCVNPSHLRVASRTQNSVNRRRSKNNTSGIKGVYRVSRTTGPDKWVSRIRINGRLIHIGTYVTAEEARDEYLRVAREHFGEFAFMEGAA